MVMVDHHISELDSGGMEMSHGMDADVRGDIFIMHLFLSTIECKDMIAHLLQFGSWLYKLLTDQTHHTKAFALE